MGITVIIILVLPILLLAVPNKAHAKGKVIETLNVCEKKDLLSTATDEVPLAMSIRTQFVYIPLCIWCFQKEETFNTIIPSEILKPPETSLV